MLVVVDIKPDVHRAAEGLVPDRYATIDDLVNVALRNQVALEQQGTDSLVQAPSSAERYATPVEGDDDVREMSTKRAGAPTGAVDFRERLRVVPDGRGFAVPDPTKAIAGHDQLWGQVNRLLPVAAGVRVLANLAAEAGEKSILVTDWHREACRVASEARTWLMALDARADRKRGDLWATGFPDADRSAYRRYMNQFLGGAGGEKTKGACEVLGLVVVDGDGPDARAGVTGAGLTWSSMKNPVFDGRRPRGTFSEAEVTFYLDHISGFLPRERDFIDSVGALIRRQLTRENIDDSLANEYPELSKVIPTMRAGAIGRLFDLGLIVRERKGQFVEYFLSREAEQIGFGETR